MEAGWFRIRNHRYKVTFDYRHEYGYWVHTEYVNNGEGFCLQDALNIQRQLIQNEHRNAIIEQIE